MMSGFYRPRWEMFFDVAEQALKEGTELDHDAFVSSCKDWEWQWVSGHETYRTEPTGGELKHCRRIWDKYHEEILDLQHDYAYEAEIEAYV